MLRALLSLFNSVAPQTIFLKKTEHIESNTFHLVVLV